jgi:hypothetical protein
MIQNIGNVVEKRLAAPQLVVYGIRQSPEWPIDLPARLQGKEARPLMNGLTNVRIVANNKKVIKDKAII